MLKIMIRFYDILFSFISRFNPFILQDQSPILIRMVGKRASMKKGCNWLEGTSCIDRRPIIITKLGFQSFPKMVAHSEESKHDGVDLESVDKLRNSFLMKRTFPISYYDVL